MPLSIINRDITKVECDAIVNPTDSFYSGGGGTDRAIHKAAGIDLDKYCMTLSPLSPGAVASSPAFNLPCKYVIHTMGPVWGGGDFNETVLLRSCYLNSLFKAGELNVRSIAFPLISSGTFGFPKDRVLRIAIDAISDYLNTAETDMTVYICVISKNDYELSREIALKEYLDSTLETEFKNAAYSICADGFIEADEPDEPEEPKCKPAFYGSTIHYQKVPHQSLEDWISHQDASFTNMLLSLIDKKGMKDSECYKKANVTRKTFSKIKNVKTYRPSKLTVLAFAIALELTLDETEALLKTVGFSLSHSNTADMIVEFYIINGIYDIHEVNAALYKFDQPCLGC